MEGGHIKGAKPQKAGAYCNNLPEAVDVSEH